jgi:hypothetical protein
MESSPLRRAFSVATQFICNFMMRYETGDKPFRSRFNLTLRDAQKMDEFNALCEEVSSAFGHVAYGEELNDSLDADPDIESKMTGDALRLSELILETLKSVVHAPEYEAFLPDDARRDTQIADGFTSSGIAPGMAALCIGSPT